MAGASRALSGSSKSGGPSESGSSSGASAASAIAAAGAAGASIVTTGMAAGGASLTDLVAAAARGPAVVYGLTRPFAAFAAAKLAQARPGRRLIVVVPDDSIARKITNDIKLFMPASQHAGHPDATVLPPPALAVPALDTSPYTELKPDREALARRMAALYRLARGGELASPIVVISAQSLIRRVIPRPELERLTGELCAGAEGAEIDRDATAALLIRAGYARTSVVEDPGTFAIRGGVIDVFTPLYRYPARIELFGDTIESIRLFDPETQRTMRPIDRIVVHPVRETIATGATGNGDLRARIFAAADAAHHPSIATRRLLEQLDSGEEFIGIETLTPAFHDRMDPIWSYLDHGPADAALCWLIIDPDEVMRAATGELDSAQERYQERLAGGKLAFPPETHYVSADELGAMLGTRAHRIEARTLEVYTGAETPAPTGSVLHFSIDDNRILRSELERARRQSADELLAPLIAALGRWRRDEWRVAIAAGSPTQAHKLQSLLADYGCLARVSPEAGDASDSGGAGAPVPGQMSGPVFDIARLQPGAPPTIITGELSAGFAMAGDRLAWVSADDIFGPKRKSSARQRAAARRARQALMGGAADFAQLQPGDYLVHEMHGVGLYKGLVRLPVTRTGPEIDFLHLEYDGGRLYLPVYRLGEVQRHVGAEGHKPRIDKLGGITWDKTRRKVAQQVRALAEELLQIYAQRAVLPGHAFPSPDSMFREFEATFPFEETPDQQRAIDEVLADMESQRPMDRLVCGDVGYGKTEVALRAIFMAVMGGRQAALLAPTTVLVEQHYQTMRERFAGWPLEIAKLSRFQSRAETLAVIKGLAAGTVDAVVGTHRLLSKDVRFKDLGLLVIDEEQRFGVAHKERLKRVRTQVDVLTLTATPIPRTLHLAMSGMRDLSIIATPPADRRSVRTFVAREDDPGVLREGIRQELGRGGQVFLVCPRIGLQGTRRRGERSLEQWAEHLEELVPGTRVGVAHGQLGADALETVMVDFIAGKLDVLVSTTIIESGLDIPRANTMFVVHAERFGLSQLYQLRGRIGRSKERAFCYLLVPPPEVLSTEARRRLEALQRFSELGAGFQIASHDLEIRGGGELLGGKQSGSIAAVGFEAYVAMLEQAVAELSGKDDPAIRRARDPELNVEAPGYIPDDYVPDPSQRLDLYKRLSDAEDEDELGLISTEIEDRYGNLPIEVITLCDLMVLKVYARTLRAQSVELTRTRLTLALAPDTPLAPEAVLALVQKGPYRLTPDMRLQRVFSEEEARQPGPSARRCLLDLIAYGT